LRSPTRSSYVLQGNEPAHIAELHDSMHRSDNSATHEGFLGSRWLLVPPASGDECVRALQRLGFRLRLRDGDQVLLADGRSAVAVPLVPRLRPETIVSILRVAGVSVAAFTSSLDE
jgi:hypothetical protein